MEKLGFHRTQFHEILYLKFFSKICLEKGTVHEGLSTFMIISRSILLRLGNVLDKICGENRNTHFVFSNFFPENRAVCEIMWENMAQPERPQVTI
jgi:hypothetical protein